MPDGSITDPETIRQIALSGDRSLFIKTKPGFEVFGLYPHVMNLDKKNKWKKQTN
jgi:hypothetical protein